RQDCHRVAIGGPEQISVLFAGGFLPQADAPIVTFGKRAGLALRGMGCYGELSHDEEPLLPLQSCQKQHGNAGRAGAAARRVAIVSAGCADTTYTIRAASCSVGNRPFGVS